MKATRKHSESSDTHSLGVFTVEAQQLQRAVFLQRTIQIPQLVVHPGDHTIISQTLTAGAQTPATFSTDTHLKQEVLKQHHNNTAYMVGLTISLG